MRKILFNTREWAIIIWTIVFFLIVIFILYKNKKSNSFLSLPKQIIQLILHPIMLFSLSYIVCMFYLLIKVEFINNIGLIKDYSKILIFALFPMIFRVATKFDQIEITQIAKGIIKFSIIPLFIINEYTFNIILELIIILIIFVLNMLIAISDNNPNFNLIKKILNWILAFIVISVIVFSFNLFFNNINDIMQSIFWKKMFLELLLLFYVPLLIVVRELTYYEKILIHIKIRNRLGNKFKERISIFLILLKNCHFSKSKLDKALKKVKINKVGSYKDLNILLKI
ncbi:hypothetical protein [Jeotgalibacillus sp. R-1-5s-1]|uniref:hypothetical protein n=1 Tax=Jeotgalibacillus sp. R-1-5s-1 TaxID=2555897 RepID=UPI00106AD437|nr:hypothetical protein [Jeotgalibacillus sp. R-1-5s-1]TFD93644.1 hypothetical protein E2491_14495 [Jeotgalibacillus sp. R-1-5s-1]